MKTGIGRVETSPRGYAAFVFLGVCGIVFIAPVRRNSTALFFADEIKLDREFLNHCNQLKVRFLPKFFSRKVHAITLLRPKAMTMQNRAPGHRRWSIPERATIALRGRSLDSRCF